MTPTQFCIRQDKNDERGKNELLTPADITFNINSHHCDSYPTSKNLQYLTIGKAKASTIDDALYGAQRIACLNDMPLSAARKQQILGKQGLTDEHESDRNLQSSDLSLCTKPSLGGGEDIHSYLLNAAKNLSILTDALLKKNNSCHLCKKHFDHCKKLLFNHRNTHLRGNCTRKVSLLRYYIMLKPYSQFGFAVFSPSKA